MVSEWARGVPLTIIMNPREENDLAMDRSSHAATHVLDRGSATKHRVQYVDLNIGLL